MADPVLIQVSPAPGPAVIIPRFLQQPSQRSPDEPLHPDRHRREHRPAGGRPAFRGQGTGALHRPAQPRHRAGRHSGCHLHQLSVARSHSGIRFALDRAAQRATVHPSGSRRAGADFAAVDQRRSARGGKGCRAGQQSFPAYRRAAGDRQHPGRGHSGGAAMADRPATRTGERRGAAVPRDGQLRASVRHDRHAGGPDQPDVHARQR